MAHNRHLGHVLFPKWAHLLDVLRVHGEEFVDQVLELRFVFPHLRPELNGLFSQEDYLSTEKLRKKFNIRLEVIPIPSGDDFRVRMSAEEHARVAKEIDRNVRESLARGTADLWERLKEVVSHMVDELNEPEGRFHATLVTNVQDLAKLLPELNVGGDPDLNRFAAEIEKRLCNYNARDLKQNEILRVATAHDATALLYETDAVLRDREDAAAQSDPGAIADSMVSHMSATWRQRQSEWLPNCLSIDGSLSTRPYGRPIRSLWMSPQRIWHSLRLNNSLTRLTQEKRVRRYQSVDENG